MKTKFFEKNPWGVPQAKKSKNLLLRKMVSCVCEKTQFLTEITNLTLFWLKHSIKNEKLSNTGLPGHENAMNLKNLLFYRSFYPQIMSDS